MVTEDTMHLVRRCSAVARAALPGGGARRGAAKAACEPDTEGASELTRPAAGGAAERTLEEATKECAFDFKKPDVWPYDDSCGCQEPPPPAGCEDVGKPRQVCCVSVRQYGCHCEEPVEQCEEEPEPEQLVNKVCPLDFRKVDVNPFDEPCGCTDPPLAVSCETLNRGETCCRTSLPHGCDCSAYDRPGLDCTKQSALPAKKKKECDKKRPGTKCS